MRFYIVLEDGGVFLNCIVLTNNGIANSLYEVKKNLKTFGFITICNKNFSNYMIRYKDIYKIDISQETKINQTINQSFVF